MPTHPRPPAEFHSMADVAEMLGVSRPSVYNLIGAGAFRAVRIGGRRMVPVADLRRYIDMVTAQETA